MDDDLACGCPDALPLVAGALLGLAATAGWFLRYAWTVVHRPQSLGWLRSAR